MPRLLVITLLTACTLAACGSPRPMPTVLARIGQQTISTADVKQAMTYVSAYYPTSSRTAVTCAPSTSGPCASASRQVLARMIEENVVAQYAGNHGLALNRADWSRVHGAVDALLAGPLRGKHVAPDMLRAVVARQILVEKVERAVTPRSTRQGFQLHIRKVYFSLSEGRAAARKDAISLATAGGPAPATATSKVEWVRPNALRPAARAALAVASPGDYVGPYTERQNVVVIELLGRGRHRYGAKLRSYLETQAFHAWLRMRLTGVHPTCYDTTGHPDSCPPLA